MTQIIELVDRDIKIVTINITQIFRKVQNFLSFVKDSERTSKSEKYV